MAPSASQSSPSPEQSKSWFTYLRLALFLLGAGAVTWLVERLGAAQVWNAIVRARVWLPLVFVLDLSWLFVESLALRQIYGSQAKKIPALGWIDSYLNHFTTFMIAPMGRVTGEIARAASLGHYVGGQLASVGAALMQSVTMVTNGLVSLVACAVVLFVAPKSPLLWAIWGNLTLLMGFGIASYLVMRHVKLGGFLGRHFAKLAEAGPEFDAAFRVSRQGHLPALGFCLLSRAVQIVQYGVILLAVTGHFSIATAWIAEGIQLVARSSGDMIPNQAGVSEGLFTLFRAPLGLADSAGVALSVALIARVSNLSMAGLCALVAQFLPKEKRPI